MAERLEKRRQWLISSLQIMLVPEFVRRGFAVVALDGEDARSRDVRAAFPFGRLHRSGVRGLEMVEIQLDKHGNPAFRLNIGVSPLGGIEHASGHIAQEDMWVHYLGWYFEMYRSPRLRRWFSVLNLPWAPATERDYQTLVQSVVDMVPEVEKTLRENVPSRQMRVIE
jgi:hypothetical protein